jgi:DNA polymerase (family 10)
MPESLTNRQIADVFRTIADSMEILGEDRFRTQAYRRASESLAELPQPLTHYRKQGELSSIPGIGKAIAEKVIELLDTGHLQFYEKLRERVPAGVLDMLRIPNLGPRMVARLYEELGIADLDTLEQAIAAGKLNKMKGLGARSIAQIHDGIAVARKALVGGEGRSILLFDALRVIEQLIAAFREANPAIDQIMPVGSIRRGQAVVRDLDLLIAAEHAEAALDSFATLGMVARVDQRQPRRMRVTLHTGMHAEVAISDQASWGASLALWTGSAAHREALQARAHERGLQLEHMQLTQRDGTLIACPDEADLYRALELPWIPAELREGAGEIEAALAGTLPQLIEIGDMRADLHMHSNWSDGRADLASVAAAVRARGYRYMAITDHGAYLGITNGLDGARLEQQRAEVEALNQQYAAQGDPFRILRGVEVDITADGSLALPDAVLANLDIVVASPHVNLQQAPEQATERILRAIRNPHVDIIGHPTGRLLDRRPGLPLDIEAVARAAAAHGVLLEVNSGPDRLDLEGAAVRRALELGASVTINSDSHHPDNLPWIRLGIATARRGWAPAERVANTWNLERLQAWLQRERSDTPA